MIVLRSAGGFKAAISPLGFLDGSKGVSFHTFRLPEDSGVRLLIKNLGRQKPEDVLRGELDALGFRVYGVLQLRPGQHDQEASKANPLAANLRPIVSVARGHEVSKMCLQTELCALRVSVETYVAPKSPLQCKGCQRFGHMQRYCRYTPHCVAYGETCYFEEWCTQEQQLKCCSCGGIHTGN